MTYLIDFFLLAARVAPVNKRGFIHLAWLNVFMSPLKTLNDALFRVFFVDVKTRAKRTGQKIILEKTLNSVFNPNGVSLITIDNSGDDIESLYLYNSNEGYEPGFFYNENENQLPVYLFEESEYIGITDFVVFVPLPVVVNFTDAQISAEVDKYRPIGTTFSIKHY